MISNLLLSCLLASSVCGIAASSSYDHDAADTHISVQNAYIRDTGTYNFSYDSTYFNSDSFDFFNSRDTSLTNNFSQNFADYLVNDENDFYILVYVGNISSSTTLSFYTAENTNKLFDITWTWNINTSTFSYRVHNINRSILETSFSKSMYYYGIEFNIFGITQDMSYVFRGLSSFLNEPDFQQNIELSQYDYLNDESVVFIHFCTNRLSSYYTGVHGDAFEQGKNAGYINGQNSSTTILNLFNGMADVPFITLRGLFNFTLFGQNFYIILMSVLTLLVIVFLIRWFIK